MYNSANLSDEDKLLIAKTEDMFLLCEKNFIPVSSCFLDERQCFIAESVCKRYNSLNYSFWGGFEGAKRKKLCLYNDFYCESFKDEMGLICLTFTYRKEDKLSHRDFLGALMSLRLKREVIGDIIIAEGKTQIFVSEIAAKLILSSVSKIGRVGVKVSDEFPFELVPKTELQDIQGTVSSLRLDSVLSLAARLSREKASQFIRSVGVQLNYVQVYSSSMEMRAGDIFSAKGYGKFILGDVNGVTQKGRLHITVQKYI